MKYFRYIIITLSCLSMKSYAFDFITGEGLGLGQTVLLSQSSASTLLIVPSGGIIDGESKIELGINRKYEIKDLDQVYLVAAYRRKSFTYTIGFTQFGYQDFYAEKTAKFGVAYHYDSLTVGATFSTMLVDFGNHYERLYGSSFGLGVSYRTKKIYGAITAENLNSPNLDDNNMKMNPRYTAYTEIIGKGSYSVTGRLTLEEKQKPRFGVGQKIDVSSFSSLFWGLSTNPTTYGGGVEMIYKKSLISYAASYHPTLGFSHTIAVNYILGHVEKK